MQSLKQRGAALLGYVSLGFIAAGVASYYGIQQSQISYEEKIVNTTSMQLEQMQAAQLDCFDDMRRWCTPAEISAYQPGDNTVYGGQDITFTQVGDNLQFSVNVGDATRARKVSQMVVQPGVAGTTVTSTIRPPTEASIFADRLQRYDSTTSPEKVQMETTLGLGGNTILNLDTLEANRVTSETLDVDVLRTQRTVVSSELDIGGNRIVSRGNDVDIIAGVVAPRDTLTLQQGLASGGGDFADIGLIESAGVNFDSAIADTFVGSTASIRDVTATSTVADSVDASSGEFNALTSNEVSFDNATGESLDVDVIESNTINAATADIDTAQINTLTAGSVNSDFGNINSLTAQAIATRNAEADSGVFENLTAQSTASTTGTANSVNASTAGFSTLNSTNLTVNNRLTVSNALTVSNDLTGDVMTAGGPVVASVASVNEADINTASVTNLTAHTNNVDFADLGAESATINSLNGSTAEIVNVWVNNNMVSEDLIADVASTRLLTVETASLNTANFGALNASSVTTDDLTTRRISATNADIDSFSANRLRGGTANINDFDVGTITATTISSSFDATSYSGDSYYATGDFTTGTSSVNSNASNMEALLSAMDRCINVTGYCLEKEPDFVINCAGCTQSAPQYEFFSNITVNVTECLQGCTLNFALDGLSPVSGCGSATFPAGYSGSRTCRVKGSASTGSTSVYNPVVTMANSRRSSFSNSITTTIKYTNTVPRAPQMALTCINCNQANTSGTYTSEIEIEVTQCNDGCRLTFNLDGLNAISGCSARNLSAGYTGTLTCRVGKSLSAETTFNANLTASLENNVFGDVTTLNTLVEYENTTLAYNPPGASLTCSNCNVSDPSGSYESVLRVNITQCSDGCSLTWDVGNLNIISGCASQTFSAGYTGNSAACRVGKFVAASSSFSESVVATLENTSTGDDKEMNRTVSYSNTNVPITPSDLADDVEYRVEEVWTRSGLMQPKNVRTVTEPWAHSNNLAFMSTTAASSLEIFPQAVSGGVCDNGDCSITILSVTEVSGSCVDVANKGTSIWAYIESSGAEISCYLDATVRITHTDSGITTTESGRSRVSVRF
ncbi:hypothetical protein [Alteromonas antoniana]|uniref:hypothetical protein n=1 Tax=Alteromonas antoniana TaxID=2803813 RepID=UPI001C493717|nr:hypothetical protein [Alteromonas antoniana]